MKITERNLQEIGKSLLVSLPKEWTRLMKLKKGSQIKIRMSEDNTLIISPEFTKKQEKKEGFFDYDSNFFRNFVREYFLGSQKISISINQISEAELSNLHNTLKKFMNVQIIEEDDKKIVVKCFNIEELSIEDCLRRMYFISHDITNEIMGKNNKTTIKELESSLTKFYFMLVMQIRRFLEEGKFAQDNQISLLRALDFRMVGEKIKRIADISKDISSRDKEVLYIFKEISQLYEKAFNSFIANDYKKSLEISTEKELALLSRLENQSKKKKDVVLLENVINLERFLSYSREIAQLTR